MIVPGIVAGGGGGDVTPPAWVTALQALAASPSDLLFAYNFASGGTGQGWDGTQTRTANEVLYGNPAWGSFDPSTDIVDGVGLTSDSANPSAALVTSISAGLLASGFTCVLTGQRSGASGFYLTTVELPGYSIGLGIDSGYTGYEPSIFDYGAPKTDFGEDGAGATRIAGTFLASSISGSSEGSVVGTVTPSASISGCTDIIFAANAGEILESVAIYSPQLDAHLPVMSTLP